MRAFADTSALLKKYIEERGSRQLEQVLGGVSDLIVSPVTWVELNAAVARRLRGKLLTAQQSSWILSEAETDFCSYSQVVWGAELVEAATRMVRRHLLKTLDAIQLAAGVLSKPDLFLTSDRRLFEEARKVIQGARYIG